MEVVVHRIFTPRLTIIYIKSLYSNLRSRSGYVSKGNGRNIGMQQNIKIVLAEDHTILREGLCALLTASEGYEVVGEASNGKEALQCVANTNPDLVIMDLSMPNTNGTEAIRNIKRRFPDVKIVTLTIHKTEEYVRQIA